MMRRFVLSTAQMTPDEERQLAAALSPPWGWWHNLPNTWAIIDPTGVHSALDIRAIVERINPAAHCLVVEVAGRDWALRAPMPHGDWFRKDWQKPSA
jgi:hypothetical protein